MKPDVPTILVISQVYVPDPASVGQHMHDTAVELARRGARVVVYAANRGYDDPSRRYPAREVRDGVEIRRLPLSSFGKASIAARMIAGISFVIQATLRGLFLSGLERVLVSTSPPMAPAVGIVLSVLRRVPFVHWSMDLNPDQLIAVGKTTPTSLPARSFNALNRGVLRRAQRVIALDRFMRDRLLAKATPGRPIAVMPPWPHVDASQPPAEHEHNPWRREQGLEGKFVVMYSGNMSPVHPLDTVLDAALRLRDDPRIEFVFIGGGGGRRDVERLIARHHPPNVRLLEYQPLEVLPFSLAAADLHLVAMGDAMVGIVHPCKVYGAMAVGRPILLLGPPECHITDLIAGHDIGWQVAHGDVDAAVRALEEARDLPPQRLRAMGERARHLIAHHLDAAQLCGRFCDVVQGIAADDTDATGNGGEVEVGEGG